MNENPEKKLNQPPQTPEKPEQQKEDGESLESAEKTLSVEEVKQRLFDPRLISKEYDKEGRAEIAVDIGRGRKETGFVRGKIAEKENALLEIEQQAETLDLAQADKMLELEQRLEKVLVRLKDVFGIKDEIAEGLEADARVTKEEVGALTSEVGEIQATIEQLQQRQSEIPKSAELLRAYYEKMEVVPLTNEEKRELLKPEVLAELSAEEYVALWRRLNPHFLSHVTRQGFRDHNAMVYHSGGLQEFHDGLVNVLEDDKILRPPIAIRDGLRSRDESTVRKFLGDWALKAENEEEAKKRLNAQLNHTLATAPNYPDKTAVHFATQIVADEYYGGEKSNEVFFLYPADVLASQHNFAFNGREKDFTQPQSETKWNDVFVWPSTLDNPGIPIDSGLVFLPENTPVDPETGSKYASEIETVEGEEKRVMVEDEKLVFAFVEWATSLTDESTAIKAYKNYCDKRNCWEQQSIEKDLVDIIRKEMLALGFCEETADDLTREVLYNLQAFTYHGKLDWGDSTPEEAARSRLRSASANWIRAENTISSKEYWEAYFEQYPEQKPKHLVFYDGTPTTAIHEFQQKNGIGQADVSESEGKLLGFDDGHILNMKENPKVNRGYDDLVATSHRIIEEHYRR